MKTTILDQKEISPLQRGAYARAKKYAEMKKKVCTSCKNEFPIEEMQEGRSKCKLCYRDLERIRNKNRKRKSNSKK